MRNLEEDYFSAPSVLEKDVFDLTSSFYFSLSFSNHRSLYLSNSFTLSLSAFLSFFFTIASFSSFISY